jgi:hypothetical protein
VAAEKGQLDVLDFLLRVELGFGRIVVSQTEIPHVLVTLVRSEWVVVQSENATEP